MPPPAPRPLRANEDKIPSKIKSAPKKDPPKTIPQTNRDKCGACSQDHDIRYCPYPNTEDGRTKICPICDTTKHAWHECWYYKRDITEQWNVCWENRRCLPTLVHDASLDEILGSMVSLARETSNKYGPSPLEKLNYHFKKRPGPLSPAFVKNLMPPDVRDNHVQQALQDGRMLPWQLEKKILQCPVKRPGMAVRDPATTEMSPESYILGTSTTRVPGAAKLKYFHDLDAIDRANNAVYSEIQATKMNRAELKALVEKRRRIRLPSSTDDIVMDCANCGSSDHRHMKCPSPCRECGRKMVEHGIEIEGTECTAGCLCKPQPGHRRPDCTQLCRPCVLLNKDSNTAIKDCTEHCPVHITTDGTDHSDCKRMTKRCNACEGKHWYQDCTEFLGRICPLDFCHKVDCTTHCCKCGGSNVDGVAALFPNNEDTAYRRHVEELVGIWHQFLETRQWERVVTPDASITKGAWSVLRCKTHKDIEVDVASLEQVRAATWSAVVECVRGGLTEMTVTRAKALLRVPECEACCRVTDTMISEP